MHNYVLCRNAESILLLDTYGKGKLFTLAAPYCFADFAKLPIPVMDMIRRPFASHGLYISGRNVSLFQYSNDTFVLYCYAGSNALPERVSIHLLSPACHLTELSGKPIGNLAKSAKQSGAASVKSFPLP